MEAISMGREQQMPEDISRTEEVERKKRESRTAQIDEDRKESERIERMKKKQEPPAK
jgi:hypothetical protein